MWDHDGLYEPEAGARRDRQQSGNQTKQGSVDVFFTLLKNSDKGM